MKQHNDTVNKVWFKLMNRASLDLFQKNVAFVADPKIVGECDQLSASDKDAIDQILSEGQMKMVEYNHQLLIGRI